MTPTIRASVSVRRGAAIAGLVLSLAAVACAAPGFGSSADPSQHLRSGRSASYLGVVELASAPLPAGASLLDAIVRLRPEYLRMLDGPAVFVNGTRADGVEALRYLRAEEVLEVRFLNRSEAQFVVGSWAVPQAGAIVVRLRTGGTI